MGVICYSLLYPHHHLPLTQLPFTLQTSIFPWPSKTTPLLSHTGQARLVQLCIINIFNIKKKERRKVSVEIWVFLATTHHPLIPLPRALNASSQPGLFALEAANWESIAELAARRLKRTTDKDILANEDNSAALSYLFVPVSLSNLAVK